MKKILLLFVGVVLVPNIVYADTIKNIDMEVNLNKDGSANIVETWDVKATEGAEWCKMISDSDELAISNFSVTMDGKLLEEITWDPNGDIESNADKFGIKYTNLGYELCFGKKDSNDHTFVLNYTLSDFVFNTDDGQVIYYTLLPKSTVDDFKVTIKSETKLDDNLEISGYGYNGYVNIEDGVIELTNDKELQNEYVVLLTKFKSDTFETDVKKEDYATYDSISNDVEDKHVIVAKVGKSNKVFKNNVLPVVIVSVIVIALVICFVLIKMKKIDLSKLKINKRNK